MQPRIVASSFDSKMWVLKLTTEGAGRTEIVELDLTKYDGFGIEGAVLRKTEICECGGMVFFPDFPAPGAMISIEPLEEETAGGQES